jgi:hypothetical protein
MSVETPEAPAPQAPPTPQVVDYWGTDEKHKHYLPDGVQYFEFKIMNEGDKVKFQKLTNQDLVVGRDNSARVKVSPETERHTLIETSVTDWYLFIKDDRSGEMVPAAFNKTMLRNWLSVAPPKIVEDLEYAIRMANPWMQAEMTVEEIDKEMDRLVDLRKQIVEREAGEASSATK